MRFLSQLFLFLGIILISVGIFFVYQRHNPQRLAFANVSQSLGKEEASKDITPSQLIIASIGVDLPISPSEIKNGKWSDTKSGVSYLASSPNPGNKGNSIIYGHNWAGLLGSLPRVKPGDRIVVVFSDRSMRTFEVAFTSIVDPSQTGVLAQSEEERLTVYTCTGFLDSKRFVATATRIK